MRFALYARGVVISIALSGALAPIAGCAAHRDAAEVKATLQQRYAAYAQAIAQRDGPALSAILAPNFEAINADGRSAPGALLVRQVTSFPRDPNMHSAASIGALRLDGDKAIASVTTVLTSLRISKGVPPAHVRFVTVSDDTWVDKGGTWLYERTVANRVDAYTDGKLTLHEVRSTTPAPPALGLPTP